VEVLIGFLSGTIVFLYYYGEYLKKEKRLQKIIIILKSMEAKSEERMWKKIDSIEAEIVNIKVALAKIITKVGFITAGASFVGAIIVAVIKEVAFK
jgi:hypothetical protein